MDAAVILADKISEILRRSDSSATLLSEGDLKLFKPNLEQVLEGVQKAKHDHSEKSQKWVEDVKEVVNDLNDLMEDLSLKDTNITATKALLQAGHNMTHRRKARQQIKELDGKLQGFVKDLPNSDQAFFKKAFGRENEKKEIMGQLNLGDKKKESELPDPVITIVGDAGIGKTLLARLVCEDEQVKAHFNPPIWFYGIHEASALKSIYTRVPESTTKEKPVLLVLDDLKTEIKDEFLRELKQKFTHGVALLITTRTNRVTAATVKPHTAQLQGLNEEDSWSLFLKICGSSRKKEDTEREIVKCCSGVPEAIIITARLLNSRGSPVAEEQVAPLKELVLKLPSYIQLPTHQKLCFSYFSLFPRGYFFDSEILIRLWLAEGFLRRNLPSNKNHPRLLGEACLKDFDPFVFEQVEKDEFGVIRRFKVNSEMFDLAKIVACEENIMLDSGGDNVDSRVLRVSFNFDFDVSCGIPNSLFENVKNLRTILLVAKSKKSRLPHEVKMSASTCDKIFNSFKCLRVVDLHDLGIAVVPNSIGEMEQLRYLDLSNNNIEKIPSCITELSHLQTLKLSQCYNLKELPKDLGDLSCLVHLDIEGCMDLTHMPRGISKLSSLETLSLFAASKKYPFGGLVELKDLNDLRGNLEILHLEKLVLRGKTTENQCLKEKQHLQQLTLRWDHYDDDEDEDEEEEEKKKGKERGNNKDDKNKDEDKESLDYLEPHEDLEVLIVEGYNGLKFSNWLSSIKNLVKFSLSDCPRCEFLPALDQLQHLKVLELWRLDSLKFIAENRDTKKDESFFTNLKELTISDCPELETWWKGVTYETIQEKPFFNSISKLHIQCCPKLKCMPLYPYLDEKFILGDSSVIPMQHTMHAKTENDSPSFSKLKSMMIERIDVSPPPTWLINFTSLEDLHIRDCSKLENLPKGFNSMRSLTRLTIEKCPKLNLDGSSEEWKGLTKLWSLILREIPLLKSLPEGIEHVTSLTELELYQCSGLSHLKEGISKLTSLRRLVFSECRKLGSLPKEMAMLQSLETLKIMDCPLLMTRCQPDTGDDWPQIRRVKNIVLRQTSKDMGKDFYY